MEKSNISYLKELAELSAKLHKESLESLKNPKNYEETKTALNSFLDFIRQTPNDNFTSLYVSWPESTFARIDIPQYGIAQDPKDVMSFIAAMKASEKTKDS